MKTKLLRKVRRNYRIIRNGYGDEKIQTRIFFIWSDISPFIGFKCSIGASNIEDVFINLLIYNHGKYHRKTKVAKQKKNTWETVWYNAR